MAADIPVYTLNDGNKIASVGMGCWMGTYGGDVRVLEMCGKALKQGYRHFDTASGYGNEQQVGKAIRESGIPRSEIYLTTKLNNCDHHRVRDAFHESFQALDCEYIDLYLVHWPQAKKPESDGGFTGPEIEAATLPPDQSPTIVETWKELEKLLETGKVKSIGVSNFSIKTLTELLTHCTVVPAVNQVELHPYLPSFGLKAFCEEKGILLTAYSPLGQPAAGSPSVFFEEPAVKDISAKLKVTPAQVLLSWGVQRGTVVIPKSENEERMRHNITLVKLSEEDIKAIDAIHTQPEKHKTLLLYLHGPNGTVMGWKYEWLGWNMTKEGIILSGS